MFADEIRRAIGVSPRAKLPELAALMWRALASGQIGEAEAESLSAEIEARRIIPVAPVAARRRVGSRPRTDASMERRRRWAASGRLPPQLAARFTLAEQAVLAAVAAEVARRGDCRLALDHLAALAGVARSTVKATLRRAESLGCLTIEERRLTSWRSDTNIVRIIAGEWLAWMRLARRDTPQGGGVKSSAPTSTNRSTGQILCPVGTTEKLPEGRKRASAGGERESWRSWGQVSGRR